jgi:hypothetical protein
MNILISFKKNEKTNEISLKYIIDNKAYDIGPAGVEVRRGAGSYVRGHCVKSEIFNMKFLINGEYV